jgi:catechol-2,3-dioxygenase
MLLDQKRLRESRCRDLVAAAFDKIMLRKIDCVMIRVGDVHAVANYYPKVFGLRPLWSGDGSIGLGFPETDAEIVIHSDPNIPLCFV